MNNIARRFVILEHTGTPSYKPGVHWDLLCEEGDVLRAWEFTYPVTQTGQQVVALPPHRRIYLDYEGPISSNRGVVRRVAEGEFRVIEESPIAWRVRLEGDVLQGELWLTRPSAENPLWTALFTPLKYCPDYANG